ncbi:MAG TPA: hypothetical protein VGK99_06915 [Acidobacteriota bacterium]|jgi:hypothetical protein
MNRDLLFHLDPVSELEMWISCLQGYFKYQALSFAESERVVGLGKNFVEEARTAAWILEKIGELATDLALSELSEVKDVKWEDASVRGNLPLEFFRYRKQTAVAGRVILLAQTVNDFRIILREKLESQSIPLVFFKSMGRLLNHEFIAFRKNKTATKLRHKYIERTWQDIVELEVLGEIRSAEMRLETLALFARIYRVLSRIRYIRTGLRSHFNYRAFFALLSHMHTDGKGILQRLEQWSARWELLVPNSAEEVTTLIFALKVEMKRVFKQELGGIEKETQIEEIYSHLEDAAGLLWNCFQNVFISIARSFNRGFDEYLLFTDIELRLEESVRVQADLSTLRELVGQLAENFSAAGFASLQRLLHIFCENSMRCLMFKDWGLVEGFVDQLKSCPAGELKDVLHRFHVFLDTLLGAVERRAVFRALEPAAEEGEMLG